MSATKLLNDVVEITKRPDARARSLLGVNTIIADIVTNYDYDEDLVETTLDSPDPTSNYAVISLASLPVRKVFYLTANNCQLKMVSPRQALDSVGCQMVNCFYISGSNLIIHASAAFPSVRLGYYAAPSQVSETVEPTTHWLIDKYPAVMLNGVVAATFQATGDDVSAAFYQRQYLQLRGQIRRQSLGD